MLDPTQTVLNSSSPRSSFPPSNYLPFLRSPFSSLTLESVSTPHLDGKHVVFGKVRSNRGLVRRIESLPTTSDKPNEPVVISAAGVLSAEELEKEEAERKKVQEEASSGAEDIWEVSGDGHFG